MKPALCIIVPVLDEAPELAARLERLQRFRARGARLVVVDGGSADASLDIARAFADLAFVAPRGRASQMNAGAAACPAEVFLFLHADTSLPDDADLLVRQACAGSGQWGRFDVHIDSPRLMLRLVARLMNLRSRWSGIATGDQAMFVRRDLFDSVGGFPELALMEDIAISTRLKQRARPVCLSQTVRTSARRWERGGVWKTIFLMWRLRVAFFLGADPDHLAIQYGYKARRDD